MNIQFLTLIDSLFRSNDWLQATQYPWFQFFIFLILTVPITIYFSKRKTFRAVGAFGLFLIACVYFVIALHYLGFDKFTDHGESHVAALAAWFFKGHPLYPGPSDFADYGNFYGPVAYLVFGFLPALGLHFFAAAKVPGVLCYVIAICFFWVHLGRARLPQYLRSVWTLAFIIALGYFESASFFSRADPLVLLPIVLAYVFSGNLVLAGFLLGLAVNIKVQSIAFSIPLLSQYLSAPASRKRIPLAFLAGSVGLIFPYFLLDSSVTNQITLLRSAVDQGRDWSSITTRFVPQVLFFGMPLWFSRVSRATKLLSLVTGLFLCLIAAKPGSGSYQFMPFVALSWILAIPTTRLGHALPAFLMTLISISLPLQYSTLKQMRGNAKEQVLEDYKDITQKLGQRFGAVDSDVSIGWGDNSTGDTYFLSFYRVYPVWKGAPYYFDLGIQMDMRIGGRQTSRKAEDAIKSCVYKFWLIPKNERPFEMKNYNTHEPIYQDWFIQTFHQSYRILDQSRYFDVWACTSVTEAPASIPNQ